MNNVDITHGGSRLTIEYANGEEASASFTFPDEADRWARYYAGQHSNRDVTRVLIVTTATYEESK